MLTLLKHLGLADFPITSGLSFLVPVAFVANNTVSLSLFFIKIYKFKIQINFNLIITNLNET
jgi:hypothetical protein